MVSTAGFFRNGEAAVAAMALALSFGNDPDGMDDSGNVTQQRQEDIQPECPGDTHLEEDPQRWENNGD